MNTLTIKDIPLTQELSVDAARNIVGGNPGLAIALAVAGYLGGKLIEGVVDSSGVLEPVVKVTKDGVTFLGQKV